MGYHFVSISTDLAVAPPTMHETHAQPCFHAEDIVPMYYPPGEADHQLSTRVVHRSFGIAQAGHDCGKHIFHVPAGPNFKLPSVILGSSRKMMFAAADVRIQGAPTALCDIGSCMPMLACAHPAPFMAADMTNLSNSVLINATAMDAIRGIENLLTTVGVSMIAAEIPDADELGPLGKLIGNPKSMAVKAMLSLLAFPHKHALHGKGKIEIPFLSNPKYEGKFVFEKKADGTWEGKIEGSERFGSAYEGTTRRSTKKTTYSRDGDGTVKTEVEEKRLPGGGREVKTTTTKFDGRGRPLGYEEKTQIHDGEGVVTSSTKSSHTHPQGEERPFSWGPQAVEGLEGLAG